MKKLLALLLAVLALVSVISLAGCGKKASEETLKFGMGVYSYIADATSATADKNGTGEVVGTVAAVLLDKDGKVISCALDTADNTVNFTNDGKAVKAADFKTKYEAGDAYGMVAYGNAKKEWFEQADAFAGVVKGKTLAEIKALVAGDKATDEVINAGCTIDVADFIKAVEKAINNAKEVKASADATIKLGVVSSQTAVKDATAEAKGSNEVSTTFAAALLGADKKVIKLVTDCTQTAFDFDNKGATTTAKADVTTKREAGDNYGMVAYGNAKKEWYAQADAFDKLCEGKNSSEISALVTDSGKGTDEVQSAGCTIYVTDLVKAAVKAATV